MRFKFVGTGNAAGIPAYGCDCCACIRAQNITDHRRGPCSAALMFDDETLMLDAGSLQLGERFPAGSFSRIIIWIMCKVYFPFAGELDHLFLCMDLLTSRAVMIYLNIRGF